jgi:hypothetical protein
MKRRPLAKAVLLALADRAADDGTGAWPSVRTIADEVELGKRTTDAVLAALKAEGLIEEQAPPGQHRPRTWRLHLARITRLADTQHGAPLASADAQQAAPLPMASDTQDVATLRGPASHSETQISESGSQISWSGSQHVATDPVLLNGPLNDTAPSARLAHTGTSPTNGRRAALAREPAADGNFHVIVKVVHEVMAATGLTKPNGDLVEAVKCACAKAQIDIGRDPAVAADVVARAVECAYMQRVVAGIGPTPTRQPGRRRRE